MHVKKRMWFHRANTPSFPSSPSSSPFFPDSYSVSDAYLSSAYASYDRQTQSHLKTPTESGIVSVLACVSLQCPFLDGRLETSNVSLGYGCVNPHDGNIENAENESMSDVDLYLCPRLCLDPSDGPSRPDHVYSFCQGFDFVCDCHIVGLSWPYCK